MASDDNVFVNHSMNGYVGMTKVDKFIYFWIQVRQMQFNFFFTIPSLI